VSTDPISDAINERLASDPRSSNRNAVMARREHSPGIRGLC
jgi:hypothetical protein